MTFNFDRCHKQNSYRYRPWKSRPFKSMSIVMALPHQKRFHPQKKHPTTIKSSPQQKQCTNSCPLMEMISNNAFSQNWSQINHPQNLCRWHQGSRPGSPRSPRSARSMNSRGAVWDLLGWLFGKEVNKTWVPIEFYEYLCNFPRFQLVHDIDRPIQHFGHCGIIASRDINIFALSTSMLKYCNRNVLSIKLIICIYFLQFWRLACEIE